MSVATSTRPAKRTSRPKSAPPRRPKAGNLATLVAPIVDDQHPISQLNSEHIIALQRTIGNRGVQRLLTRRRKIAANKHDASPRIQRHTIDNAPPIPEEDEIQTKRMVQRTVDPRSRVQRKDSPVGDISSAPSAAPTIQRTALTVSAVREGGLMLGGFAHTIKLREAVRQYQTGFKASTPLEHKKLLQDIVDNCDSFDEAEAKVLKKNKWLKNSKALRKSTVKKLRAAAAKEIPAVDNFIEFVKQPYELLNHTVGKNGKFDVKYEPAKKLASINVKVKFAFPEVAGVPTKEQLEEQQAYRTKFANTIQTAWGGKYQFKNVRKPIAVWGRLSPTNVAVNVNEVEAGQHFSIEARPTTEGRASVGGGVAKLWKGSEDKKEAFNPGTQEGELKRVARILPEVKFANRSFIIKNTYLPSLEFLATYLRRINNPKFKLEIVGHANAGGLAETNQTFSEKRAKAVKDNLVGHGLTNHTLEDKGVGAAGATKSGSWRKVEIKHSLADAGWKNKQDVTPHEFGHMIGLGDEYDTGAGSKKATHYALTKKALGKKYADQVAKQGDSDYASVMEGGDDIRIQHYVTFWDALVETTRTKATVPDPKFGHDDWQFIG